MSASTRSVEAGSVFMSFVLAEDGETHPRENGRPADVWVRRGAIVGLSMVALAWAFTCGQDVHSGVAHQEGSRNHHRNQWPI